MSSIQQTLLKTRPPRVKITYDVEKGNAIEKEELPFIVGVLADLAGENIQNQTTLKERNFVEINGDNFNLVLSAINPTVTINVKNIIDPKTKTLRYTLNFTNFDDFTPGKISLQIPLLNTLVNRRKALLDLTAKLDSNPVLSDKILAIIINKETRKKFYDEMSKKTPETIVKIGAELGLLKVEGKSDFIETLLTELYISLKEFDNINIDNVDDPYAFLISIVTTIDKNLSLQMDEILHDPNFQKLEASWRGLYYLVHNTLSSTSLKLKVLNLTKKEMRDDLVKAVEFDQSALFKKIYEAEYGTLGGTPYSCLIGDFAFGRKASDIEILRHVSKLAAAAHAPFIGGVDASMFDLKSFADLGIPRDLAVLFESSELAAWNSFRTTEDSRYVSLVLPKVLLRAPYDAEEGLCEEFSYTEIIQGTNDDHFCWGNPAYVIAANITKSFAEFSWTTAIRGVEGGGKVANLPIYTYETDHGDIEMKCPSQVAITDRREKELSDLGFISLCHAKGTDYSVFFGAQTTQKPKRYNTPDATANAILSTKLPYLLNASRFAHYIKMLMRAKIGSFLTAAEVQTYLQNWIAEYVLLSDLGTQEVKSKYPLRMAKITVVDTPESPGSYKAIMLLKPHFQLEDLAVSLRLVAKI